MAGITSPGREEKESLLVVDAGSWECSEFEFWDGRFTELVVVEGTGEFSPDTKPKASNGEYFLRG